MSLDFSFKTTGLAEATRSLHGMSELAGDLRPAFSQVVDWFHHWQRNRFQNRAGGMWAPLKQRTVRRKGNARVLIDTGRLMRSLTKSAAGSVTDIRRESLEVGTRVPYASYQNKRRRLIRMTSSARGDIMRIITDHILGDDR